MKRFISSLLIGMLCMGLLLTAHAETADDSYNTITQYYSDFLSAEESQDTPGAIEILKKLRDYYEKFMPEDDKNYRDIPNYYYYALGRIELDEETPDYADARKNLSKCGGYLYEVTAYLQYATGMDAMGRGNYHDAITNLRSAEDVLKDDTAKFKAALEECEMLYKSSVKSKGEAACQAGKHDKAQEYYSDYLELFAYDTEIRDLLEICQEQHNEDIVEELGLEIISASSRKNAVTLRWKGNPEHYSVSWTKDLVHREETKSAEVDGKSYTVEGLLPSTVYRFTITCQNVSIQTDRETLKADALFSDKYWTGASSLYRFNNKRYDFMDSGMTSYEYKGANKKNYVYLSDKKVNLYEDSIIDSCILFSFTTTSKTVSEDMEGMAYQLLLHIDEVTTLTEEGLFGVPDENGVVRVCAKDNIIYVLVYDLWDQAVDNYSDLAEKAFRLDLLMDGKYVASAEGTLQ